MFQKVTAHVEKVTAHVDIAYRRLQRSLPKSYGAVIVILHISYDKRTYVNRYVSIDGGIT